jgi:ABC-type antimicrobial peptide transport system permease subunit
MVIREGMTLVVLGSVLGLVGAAALTHLMSSLLYGVSAFDPLTLTAVPALLASVAMLASYLAARRALSVEPMAALREG